MKRQLGIILVILSLICILPSATLADSSFDYDATLERSRELFQWDVQTSWATMRNGKEVDLKYINFFDACFGNGSVTDSAIANTRVFWTLSIVNSDIDPAQLEVLIGINSDSPLIKENILPYTTSPIGKYRLTFTDATMSKTIIADVEEVDDINVTHMKKKDAEPSGYTFWVVAANAELKTMLCTNSSFPLSCTLTYESTTVPMLLTAEGAEACPVIISLFNIGTGNGDEVMLTSYTDQKAAADAEMAALAQIRIDMLQSIADSQPNYLAVFPKAALDYYLAALKSRDAEAFIQCTQYSEMLTDTFAASVSASQKTGADDQRLITLDYLRRAVLKCFGKQVKTARNDKPDTYFNMICLSPYPKGYKKYSVTILYPQDEGFADEVNKDLFSDIDIQAVAVIRITDGKEPQEFHVFQINGQWYVQDNTVMIAYSILNTDSLSVELLKQILAN